MTQKLFYDNPKQTRFTATVVAVENDGIILDRTCFYPRGGHQNCDLGVIFVREQAPIAVLGVRDSDRGVVHRVTRPVQFTLGEVVTGEVDWEHRWHLSCLHSGQHVLSRLILDEYGLETQRSDFSAEGGFIVLSGELREDALAGLQRRVAEIAHQDAPVERTWSGDASSVKIGDVDESLCGGTHVFTTRDLQDLILLGVDGRKLIYDAGPPGRARAAAYAREGWLATRVLGSTPIRPVLERLVEERREAIERLERLEEQTLAAALLNAVPREWPSSALQWVLVDSEACGSSLKRSIKEYAPRAGVALTVIRTPSKIILLGHDDRVEVDGLCRAALSVCPQCRGGGNKRQAEIGVASPDQAPVILDAVLAAATRALADR